jgi:predicted transcriptional regulator
MARINRTLARLARYTSGTLKPASIGEWARYHGISRRTATRDLITLANAGLVDYERHEKNNGIGYEWKLVVYPSQSFLGDGDV